ncbi:MAG: hypothetical protein AB7U41_03305 [Dongiaceae bacterium]
MPPAPSSAHKKTSALQLIDQQIAVILRQLPHDIEKSKPGGSETASFLTYPLFDENSAPLSEGYLRECAISANDLETGHGFRNLQEYCSRSFFRVVFDRYLDFDNPGSDRLLRLLVDGW